MAFESLSERLGEAFRNITGKRKLSGKNTNDTLREVHMSLLEADADYSVVKDFITRIKEQALGMEVMASLNPGQMVIKITCDEVIALLGNESAPVDCKSSGVTTVTMVDLRGTGKTTASAEIANVMKKKQGRRPLLVARDVIRPVAIEQLKTLGESIDVEVFSLGMETKALGTAKQSMDYAEENDYNTVPFDIAGRLHVDEELIQELPSIEAFIYPNDVLLTIDAMARQGIVSIANSFHKQLEVISPVLTRLDGGPRDDGILFARSITQVLVKSVGLSEKINDLDMFHPGHVTNRALGMRDIMFLVEQARDKVGIEASTKFASRMMSGQFTLTDMLVQFRQLEKMGFLGGAMKLVPGMDQLAGQIDKAKTDNKMRKNTTVVQSMAMEGRGNPNILRASGGDRTAKGSGTAVADTDRLLNEYEKMKQVMKQMGAMTKSDKVPGVGGMGAMGAMKNMRSMNKVMRQDKKRGE